MEEEKWYDNLLFPPISRQDVKYNERKLKQAKEMEKQHIIDSNGNKTKKSGGITNHTYILTGEQYYNEKFNK